MSLIWKVKLFNKIDATKAECIECKETKREKYEFKLPKGSAYSLKVHLFSPLHSNSEYADLYRELEAKGESGSQTKITDTMSMHTSSKFSFFLNKNQL